MESARIENLISTRVARRRQSGMLGPSRGERPHGPFVDSQTNIAEAIVQIIEVAAEAV